MLKVLFLGCSRIQLPYLRAAKTLGFYIILTDTNRKSPGISLADKYYCVSYTDSKALLDIANIENLCCDDHIFTAATQFAYEGAALVAEERDIEFISSKNVDIVLNKVKFYALSKQMSIPTPLTYIFNKENKCELDNKKVYYLKSDYGKSPNYCYRIVDGIFPKLPKNKDIYYRHNFLVQEEVIGIHYRVNIFDKRRVIFKKDSDLLCYTVSNTGMNDHLFVPDLEKIVLRLSITNYIVKFDIVVNNSDWWVLDIGIDPPMRLRLLCDGLNLDFPMAYIKYYLTGESDLLPKYVPNSIKIDNENYSIN